jgi:hypothetical protein
VLLIHVSALLKGHMQNILRDPARVANQNISSDTTAMAQAVEILLYLIIITYRKNTFWSLASKYSFFVDVRTNFYVHNFKGKNTSVILYLALDVSHLLLSRCRVSVVQGMDKILETAVKDTLLY